MTSPNDDVRLKRVEESKKPTLPRGVKMIKLAEDRIVLMQFVMGRWTQLPPEEEKKLIELCR